MARNHARIFVKIWHDPHFRGLTVDAQLAYFTALSNPELTYVGVMDHLPQRMAALAKGNTRQRVTKALTELKRERFVVIDEDTAELCIRSMVRHDGVFGRVNMGKATARAFGKVMSLAIREALIDEMARLYRDDDNLPGWDGFAELDPDAFDLVTTTASRMASGM